MAGIGFELKKILRRDTYSSEIKAYLYSALISSGPWVLSVSCIALLGLYRFSGIGSFDYEVFRATVTCTFAFSLIFVGIFQLVVTRYLADRFYAEDERITLATFITSSVMILCGGVMLSVPFYMMFPLPFGYKMLGVILFEIICGIWMTMIFIAAVKNYNSIVYAFAAGVTVSIGGALLLGKCYGLTGYL
ncbi:MAG TPA: exopolysaccharide Pel transporter PelG, partial [Smithellaceae bacterium]|nr:exopolysaccharide Pel transporter PelG [Smithellaceae bacterium]